MTGHFPQILASELEATQDRTMANPEGLSVLKHFGPLLALVIIVGLWVPDVLWVRLKVQFQHPILVPTNETAAT